MTMSAVLPAALIASALAPQPLDRLPADLNPLIQALQSKGFNVRIALPPVRGSYGLFQAKSKTLWISPLTIPLGIVRQTVLHEAVHAAQSCPSGRLTPLGWSAQLNPGWYGKSAASFSAATTTATVHWNGRPSCCRASGMRFQNL